MEKVLLIVVLLLGGCWQPVGLDPETDSDTQALSCDEVEADLEACYFDFGCDPEICTCEWELYAVTCDVNAHHFEGRTND